MLVSGVAWKWLRCRLTCHVLLSFVTAGLDRRLISRGFLWRKPPIISFIKAAFSSTQTDAAITRPIQVMLRVVVDRGR